MFSKILLLAIALVLLPGCATSALQQRSPAIYEAKPVSVTKGKASFYKAHFTSSGELYNKEDATAAHRVLKFNTIVRVTNLKNSKSVIVRINDRGPYIKKNLIDLNLKAAEQLEMIEDGVVPVRIEVLKPIHIIKKPNLHQEKSEHVS